VKIHPISNSKGSVFFGMHFYSGLAEYQEPNGESYRVYLNEDTIRQMDPTFEGRPIFVDHVDGVDPDMDELRKEADGWVLKSFYNEADGKHWVQFIIVSDIGLSAIRNGMRLSNAYVPTSFKNGGIWNGISYQKEITGGQYDHLAIVKSPRYDESVIMTPEEFRHYNESQLLELKKMSNSKDNKENKMGFNFFKKAKVENSIDLESISVTLPKSGKEKTIIQLVNEADKKEMDMNSGLADMSHKVKMKDGSYCNVSELLEKHNKMCDELEAMKEKNGSEEDLETKKKDVEVEGDEAKKDNEDDEPGMGEMNEDEDKNEKKKMNDLQNKAMAKLKADALRNAKSEWLKKEQEKLFNEQTESTIMLPKDKVALGNKMFGSKKYNK
jgi:hypothetical protein